MNIIYLKNLHFNNININKIKRKNNYKESNELVILTNNGMIKEINNKLYNIHNTYNIENETDDCYHIKINKKKTNIYQIPIENKIINIKKITFNFGKTTSFVIEYFDNKINDFYISIKDNQNLENFFLSEEISYIKKMLI